MGLALNLRQIVGQLLQLDVVGNGPQLKHNAGTMEMRNSTDTGFVITRGSDPVGNNDFVTKGAGDLAYWRSVNPNWLVTDWYIDGVTGDDTNSGTVIGSPIKTGAELLRRLGPYAMWPQSVTVHVLANGMIDALILRGAMMVAGTHLDILGTPTQLADAGTIATYAPRNHATPIADEITSTLIADWTPYQWARVRVTGGANTDVVTWVAKSNPAGVGVATARISKPCSVNTTSNTSIVNTVPVLAVGNPVVIEQLPIIPAVCIYLDGPVSVTATPAYSRRQLFIADIDTLNLQLRSTAFLGNYVSCQRSKIANAEIFVGNTNNITVGIIAGCLIYSRGPLTNCKFPIAAILNVLFGDPGSAAFVTTVTNSFGMNILLQGMRFTAGNAGMVQLTDIQIFDTTSAASAAFTITNVRITNVSGSGNPGYGIAIPNSAVTVLTGTINLLAAVSNGLLSAAPTVSLTFPQLLQPSDYAQKGITPAMVAGVTIVTVPWYDNATQRVTVSHAAFAGTPGILSVQQISNTQFTITSSSALDTSTIPMG
jgi:hypothetical protein